MKKKSTEKPEDSFFPEHLAEGTELLGGIYRIGRFINNGGFGMTYLAKDSLDRDVVIKECFPAEICVRDAKTGKVHPRKQPETYQRIVKSFHREAQAISKLDHPNVVHVHNVFKENGTSFLAMDYVHGTDLLELILSNSPLLRPDVIIPMLRRLLGALNYVHANNILHRDISPDNILVDENGNPVLIDFGSAGVQHDQDSRTQTRVHAVKDGYSPQELYIEGAIQAPATDFYSLGASFYHAISGETPPASQSRIHKVAEGLPDSYSSLAGRIEGYPEGFLRSIDKALSVLAKDRFQSAQAWLDALEEDHETRNVITLSADLAPGLPASRVAIETPRVETVTRTLAPMTSSQEPASTADTVDKKNWLLAGYASVAAVATIGLAIIPQVTSKKDAELASILATAELEASANPSLSPSAPQTILSEPVSAALQLASQDTPPTRPSVLRNDAGHEIKVAGLASIKGDAVPTVVQGLHRVSPQILVFGPATVNARVAAQDAPPALPLSTDLNTTSVIPNAVPVSIQADQAQLASLLVDQSTISEIASPAPAVLALSDPETDDGNGTNTIDISDASPLEAEKLTLASAKNTSSLLVGNGLSIVAPAIPRTTDLESALRAFSVETRTSLELGITTRTISTEFGRLPQIVDISQGSTVADSNPWLQPGLAIVSINGLLVETPDDLEKAFRDSALEENSQLVGTVLLLDPETETLSEVDLAVPLHRTTILETGAIFNTVNLGDGWQTIVLDPGQPEGGLARDDVLVKEEISGAFGTAPDFVGAMLSGIADEGQSSAEFVVVRDGRELLVTQALVAN